jgi:hypothetical protein
MNLVLSFGLTSALGVFMSLMNGIFHEYLNMFVHVLIDDILIYSQMREEHEKHSRLVFQCLRENKLIISLIIFNVLNNSNLLILKLLMT